ncbi:MAG: hypothetical protein BWY98_00672 [Tenericutes bacterium ADurb.BinA155]|jgi:uncharacterized Zn finger protein|nr:MAG: hypothetical protein BWY98_00672 [Tenericutes bacterium ADurb.BinA155]
MEEAGPKIEINLDALEEGIEVPLWSKAKALYEAGAVDVVERSGPNTFTSHVKGSSGNDYSVGLTLNGNQIVAHHCDCEAHRRFPGPCKHVVALLLKVAALYGDDNPFGF